jgi:transposase
MEALMARFDLTDTEWSIIARLLPGAKGKKNGRPRPDDRKVLNGIFFVLRTGTPWRDLPERDGPYTTVYSRFNRWGKAGIWLRIFEALAAKSLQSLQLIDSSIIRAHYDARAIIDLVESRGGRAHIPTCRDRKVQRSVDHALYRQRNLIERFFNKLKHFRRIATRYDRPPETSSLLLCLQPPAYGPGLSPRPRRAACRA